MGMEGVPEGYCTCWPTRHFSTRQRVQHELKAVNRLGYETSVTGLRVLEELHMITAGARWLDEAISPLRRPFLSSFFAVTTRRYVAVLGRGSEGSRRLPV